MQVIIEIDEEYYEIIKHDVKVRHSDFKPYNIIANGTPLPKGHGRLIDENDLKTLYGLDDRLWWGNAVEEFTDLPTIIEADKEDNEDE